VGADRVDQELKLIVERLRQGLGELGVELLTPADAEFASGIVAFAHPQAKEIGATPECEGVIVWPCNGRVCASVHMYNDMSDVNRYLKALAPILVRYE
jgi:selenocysteine lyase/cysteine desulfurase